MKNLRLSYNDLVSGVSAGAWKAELERTSSGYHMKVLWVAAVFDPIFAITDYFNIPGYWQLMLYIRLGVSFLTLLMFALKKKYGFPSRVNITVTFLLISLQNAFIFRLIGNENLLGQNLNYMALFVGASMFVLWEWVYSTVIVIVSGFVAAVFILMNPQIDVSQFFVNGGLLLMAVAVFMIVLIHTRYTLFIKEIKSRLALEASNKAIQVQDEEIKSINENLERLVMDRTMELERKNRALEEYAFINAHKLRSPVASILGLVNIFRTVRLDDEAKHLVSHLEDTAKKLDEIVGDITKAIEKAD